MAGKPKPGIFPDRKITSRPAHDGRAERCALQKAKANYSASRIVNRVFPSLGLPLARFPRLWRMRLKARRRDVLPRRHTFFTLALCKAQRQVLGSRNGNGRTFDTHL